ncbi:hypothetical protein BGV68_01470 [Burkholderia ubonensis]|uniref:T6SS immunity protein Tli3 family protein n=1 Tax=Burkholderia ubonensis TaxID=101571 RepID=UPI0008FDCDDE|nr:hypothetical protein [Burkholderia ubonensis]OJA64501.1 hypothetical protein BGV68_01470 [Burkholderia ubonensis]
MSLSSINLFATGFSIIGAPFIAIYDITKAMLDWLGSPLWSVPLWSVLVFASFAVWFWKRMRMKRWGIGLSMLAMLAAVPLLPVIAAQRQPDPPTQVIYRFDDHRWLELTGWECEGALTYVDAKQHIRTEASPQFYRIVFFTYIHPSERYIVIPFADMSAMMVSRDGGRTFGPEARVWVGFHNRFGDSDPTADDIKQFVVVDDRGYIETKNGRVLQSSSPIGDRWGLSYIDYPLTLSDKNLTLYDEPGFQDMKRNVPEIKGYTGWTHMKCDPNVGVVPKKTSLEGIPGLIYSAEAYTIAAPVYFGLHAYERRRTVDEASH